MGTLLIAPGMPRDEAHAIRRPGTGRGRPPEALLGRAIAGGLAVAFLLAYPLAIYLGHAYLATRGIAVLLFVLYGVPMLGLLRRRPQDLWPLVRQHLPLVALVAAAVVLDDRRLLLLLPTLVSGLLFVGFAWSLHRGPPVIERFARLIEDDLPPFTLPYCRRVTQGWCAFLALNALVTGALALAAPLEWWVLYTGPIFAGLMGLGLGGEACFRKWWFRYYGDGVVDRVLERWFPPERTARGRRSLAYVEARRSAAASPQ